MVEGVTAESRASFLNWQSTYSEHGVGEDRVSAARRRTRRRPRGNGETIRRVIYGELRRFFQHRYGPTFPDDDAGREDLRELLLLISLGPNAEIKMFNATEVWASWLPEDKAANLVYDILVMMRKEHWPDAVRLGQDLRVTYLERDRLGLWHIQPHDIPSKAGMALLRKRKDKQRKRRARQLNGAKPRAEYLAASISQTKPWIAAGFKTRRTWERKGKPRVASPSALKLTKTEDRVATREGNSGRLSDAHPLLGITGPASFTADGPVSLTAGSSERRAA